MEEVKTNFIAFLALEGQTKLASELMSKAITGNRNNLDWNEIMEVVKQVSTHEITSKLDGMLCECLTNADYDETIRVLTACIDYVRKPKNMMI